jgi:hypothetical protein
MVTAWLIGGGRTVVPSRFGARRLAPGKTMLPPAGEGGWPIRSCGGWDGGARPIYSDGGFTSMGEMGLGSVGVPLASISGWLPPLAVEVVPSRLPLSRSSLFP